MKTLDIRFTIKSLNYIFGNVLSVCKFIALLFAFMMFNSQTSYSQCNTQPNYCTPTVNNSGNFSIGIQNVTLSTSGGGSSINNNSAATGNPPHYSDYTNLVVSGTPGATVSGSVTNGAGNSTKVFAYVDWNRDGTFGTSAPELVWTSTTFTASAQVSLSFTIPSNQAPGAYRMRFEADFGGGNYGPTPCLNNYGEFEDYTLVVTSSSSGDAAAYKHTSPQFFNLGNNTIGFSMFNISNTAAMTSVDIGYQMDNNTPVTQSISGLNVASGAQYTATFSTALNIANEGAYDLKVWLNNVNGEGIQTPENDTICRTIRVCQALRGVYTLGGSGSDYSTFAEALEDLEICGIDSHVVFMIQAGTYTEFIDIQSAITGVTSSSTVTFDGIDPDDVTLTRASAGPTIAVSGASYITFKNMTINNTSSGVAFGIHLSNQANYITISNNIINVSSINFASGGIVASSSKTSATTAGNNANYLLIENNEIYGGYHGVSLWGTSTANFSVDHKLINNIIENQYYMGIYAWYINGLSLYKNYIDISSSSLGYYGTYIYYVNDLIMESNEIHALYFGLYLFFINYTGAGSNSDTRIVNNMISNGDFTNIYNYIYYVNNLEFYHNSINSFGTGSCCYSLLISQGSNLKIKNNIFVSEGSIYLLYVQGAGITEMDHNVYYAKGGGFVNWNNAIYSTLSAWQNAVPAFNANSIEEDPDFLAKRDLRIPHNRIYYQGDNTVDVPQDIYGTNRCFYIAGAYEFPIPVSPARADFLAPDTAFVNSPVLFLNNPIQGEPQYDQWFVDGVFITNDRDMEHIFTTFGVYEVTLVAENCAGDMDTLTQNVVVVNPTSPPNADFIASKVNVARGEYIGFTDMSTNGPSDWRWEVIPDQVEVFGFMLPSFNYRNGTNNQSRNPVISFPWPGLFTIQMVASNIIGTDTVIKTDYISVGYNMCPGEAPDFTSSSNHKGLLFDDGGDNNYSGNRNCNFVINPCVDTLFLIFDEFEMRCDQDFLRIWDGADANGKPLHCLDNNGPGFTGGDRICGGSCLPSDTMVLLSGQAYIEFRTASGTPDLGGFKMRWFSSDKVLTPQAIINVEDTICSTSEVDFENVSVGSGLKNFSWHYGESNHLDPTTWDEVRHGSHVYSSDGNYKVRLAVEDCEGLRDTLEHDIVVVTRLTPPVINFTADELEPMAKRDIVTFDATVSGGCNDTYEWVISTPNNIRFVNGTDKYSPAPKVIFDVPGCYDVILKVSNVTGTAIDTKLCYIKAWDYCTPYVNTNIASPDDIGISFVSLGDINNFTQMGEDEKYKNFTYLSTSLERGQTYTLIVGRNIAMNPISWAAWIDYDQNRILDDPLERIGYEASSNGNQWILTFRVPEDAVLGESRLRIGTNYGNQQQRPCGPHAHGEFHDYTVFITADVTPPVITLEPPTTVYVQVFYDYIEPGYTAWDDADGDITNNVNITSTVNTSIVGAYQVIYDVSDLAGNTATAQRNVIVMDTIWPEIALEGDDTIYIEVHNTLNDPGVTITDNYYNNIQADVVSTLNISKLGTYTIQYCATDGSGNGPVCVTRVVVVEDTTPPEVELIGGDTVYVEVYTDFIDPWLNIEDNYWGSADITVDIGGTFMDTDTLDTYFRTYTVTDASGNVTTVTRIIKVVDTTPPVITLIDSSYIEIPQWAEYKDPWVDVSDNFDEDHHIDIITGGNFTGTHIYGNYFRTYYAVDRSGNVSDMKYRHIFVVPATSIMEIDVNGYGMQLYPNPTGGEFTLTISLPAQMDAKIVITDMLGREIKTVAEGLLESSQYEVDLTKQADGIYLVRIETSEHVMTERINIAR